MQALRVGARGRLVGHDHHLSGVGRERGRSVVGDHHQPQLIGPDVAYEFLSLQPPVSAPVDGPWFTAIAAAVRRADPEAVVVPVCLTGGTDAKAFSRLGLACYGFDPLGEDPGGRRAAGTHGVDERVPVASLIWGATVLEDLLTTI